MQASGGWMTVSCASYINNMEQWALSDKNKAANRVERVIAALFVPEAEVRSNGTDRPALNNNNHMAPLSSSHLLTGPQSSRF